ncbi:hypothetical protein QBC45DRAFT_2128 [Copromyces sp. CBS 386.78]|nr:hypothetical protein QBC45DRAFT_2128 [Copromyces sp. CBS 386.78]
MPKNATITSFFKPAPRDSQDSQGSSQAPQSSIPRSPIRAVMSPFKMPGTPGTGFKSSLPIRSPIPPPYSPLTLLSSPLKPRSTVKPVRDRNAVIGASDEDDDDDSDFISSDDDLPDLFAEPKTEVPVSIRANESPTRGPSSKRVASAKFVVSPINFNKKHKFDMKAILKHTEAEKKIAESEKRVEELMAEDEEEKTAEPLAVKKEGTTTLHDDICNMMPEAEDSQEETKKEKLLRALKRTEATSQRTQWYFFDDDHGHKAVDDLSISFRNKFPQQAATGAWKILAPQKGRMDLIERGVAYHLQCKLQNIPDEIFIWIVDELPFVKTRRLRESNLRLLGICPEQAGRLLTPDRITQLFRTIGTPKRCLETPSSTSEDNSEQKKPDPGRPYNIDRDWNPLRTVLRILSETSGGLSINSLTRSTTLLLRLGMDALIRRNPDLHSTFRQTLIHLVEAVPSSSFDAFCLSCCTSLYSLTTDSCLLSDALRALPYQTPKLVNLRRRLALAFLFASASTSLFPSPFGPGSLVPSPIQEFSSRDPSQTFTLPLLLAYLDISPHFQTTRSSSSAYYFVLSAQTDLLRIAIDDGDPPSSSSSTPPVSSRSSSLPPLTRPSVRFSASKSTSKSTNPETKLHNRQVDLLTKRIRTLWSNIHDQSGSSAEISRLEAKVKLKDLERKLEWAVRTKPVSRANIFGMRSGIGGAGSGILGGGGGEDQEFDSEEEREREMKREREGTEQKMFMRRFLGKGMVAAAKTDV